MVDRFSCVFLSLKFLNIFSLSKQVLILTLCAHFLYFLFFMDCQIFHTLIFPVGFRFSLSMHMFGLLSKQAFPFFSFFLKKKSFFMGFYNCYTLTLQPGFRLPLSMHIFGLCSQSRCWLFFKEKKTFSYSHSPIRF